MSDPINPQPEGSQQISISISDTLKHGTYANFLVVSHSAHEFTLDFCQIQPGPPDRMQAEVVARLRIPPTLVGKIIRALNTNMTAYEDKFGMVREVG